MSKEIQVKVDLSDLEFVIKMIDAMSSRGAVRGEEMANIGAFRQKMQAYQSQSNIPSEDEGIEDDD